MNDIIKVILLNFILVYFLIKKNKSLSILLIVLLFMYILYLRGNKLLEGQDLIDEKKEEVKVMKMVNLDRILNKILNIYEHSEEDCIGSYSNFTPCDKKCGITHKYKTYRIERRGGLFGKSCLEEDGRRKKELCDESDGVFKCIIGEDCQEDNDCETNNCDPKTNKCVSKKVCSNTNLDLCNKEQCLDLNNHYDYALREFKFDEAESGVQCKLENKEIDNNNNNNDNNDDSDDSVYDPNTISLQECKNSWWLKTASQDENDDRLTSTGCQLKIPNSVYYENDDDNKLQERNQIYGTGDTNLEMGPGLYCKIGYRFNSDVRDSTGVTDPIVESNLVASTSPSEYCKHPFIIGNVQTPISPDNPSAVECTDGYWPPLRYFTGLNNLNQDDNKVPIDEMCSRCYNGYKLDGEDCVACVPDNTNNYNQWTQDNEGKYNKADSTKEMGKNASCTVGRIGDAEILTDTCENLKNNRGLNCNNAVFNPSGISTAANFNASCCIYCDNNQYFVEPTGDGNGSCVECSAGKIQDPVLVRTCTPCPHNTFRPSGSPTCSSCPAGSGQVPDGQQKQCGNYCDRAPGPNLNCRAKSDEQYCAAPAGKQFPPLARGLTTEGLPYSYCQDDIDSLVNAAYLPGGAAAANVVDFYDECCEFRCPSGKYKVPGGGKIL